MNHIIFYFYFTFLSILPLFGQTNNSLKSDRILEEYEQFKKYRLVDISKALEHANITYNLSIEIGDSSYINKSARAIGWLLNSKGEYDSAFYYLEKSIAVATALNDQNQLKYVLNDAGLNRLNLSKYDEALYFFNASLKVRDELNDFSSKSLAYNNIGLVYYNLEDFVEAIVFFEKGLSIAEEFQDVSTQSMNLVNIGLSYHLLKDYEKALSYFEKTITTCEEDCPVDVRIQAVGGMGLIHLDQENFEEAYKELESVINLSLENDVFRFLPSNYHYLALIDFYRKDYDKSLSFLEISNDYASKLQDVEWRKNNFALYSRIYAEQENYQVAYEYQLKLAEAKDSLLNADVIKNISDIHVNIQQDKDANIIEGKDLEITERIQQIYLLAGTVLLALVLVLFVYKNNRLRKRINDKLDNLVKERTKNLHNSNAALIDSRTELDNFIYKTSHDIQGPLTSLRGICEVGLLDVKDETGRLYLTKLGDTAKQLIEIISRLQRVNNINSTSLHHTLIDFELLIQDVLTKENEHSQDFSTIKTNVKVDPDLSFTSDEYLIVVILNNLISNAFKFIDKEKPTNTVDILVSASNNILRIEVRDNGIGIHVTDTHELFRMFSRFTDLNRTGGIGLYLVKSAVDKLSGSVFVSKSDEGQTIFVVKLPFQS
ncbi:MAG: tetratricopeptide repeat-containing sensor histidine kinase [Cyclobacteriaceae bacterium]|nr:tetratricopeptide repeat-containing sensor histidine kinase [Cyclobacteriaceae bacterium]